MLSLQRVNLRMCVRCDCSVDPDGCEPRVKSRYRLFALQAMPVLLFADAPLQRRQQVKGDIDRLEIFRGSMSQIMCERTESRVARRRGLFGVGSQSSRDLPRQQSHRDGLYVSFHPADLPGKDYIRVRLHLQRLCQDRWRIDVSVAVYLSESQEARVLESGYQPQYPRLVSKFHVVLKSHDVVGIGALVFLP